MTARDGQLIRSTGHPEVYLVAGGEARHLTDPHTFESLKLNYFDVVELPPAEMAALPVGPPISLSADAPNVVPHRGMGARSGRPAGKPGGRGNAWLAVSMAALAILSLCLVLFLPGFLVPGTGLTADARMQSESAMRTSIVQLVGGLALVAGLYFTVQNLRLSRLAFSASTKQQSIERFSRAVESLGDKDRLEVRLGGIHVLRRMADDSPEDQAVVSQIFCTLLREHRNDGDTARRGRAEPDITALASSLDSFTGRAVELSGADLGYLQLRTLNLAGAELADASLECARIDALDLTDANLIRLDGRGADLRRSSMVRAVARNANFDGADLSWSDLRFAAFILASLRNCSLVGCALEGTLFVGADLRGAILRSTDLSGADLSGAVLHGAKIDQQTRWPSTFDIESSGAELGR